MDRLLNGHLMAPPTRRTKSAAATAGVDWMKPGAVGNYYPPDWGFGGTSTRSLLSTDIGMCWLAPIMLTVGQTYNALRVVVGNASQSTHRFGIYYMSTDTALPTSLALDAGTQTWVGTGLEKIVSISFSPTQQFCALGWFYESRADSVNPSVPTLIPTAGQPWPPGYQSPSGVGAMNFYVIQSTSNSAGAMPAAGTFSLVANPTATQVQPYINIRRSA